MKLKDEYQEKIKELNERFESNKLEVEDFIINFSSKIDTEINIVAHSGGEEEEKNQYWLQGKRQPGVGRTQKNAI